MSYTLWRGWPGSILNDKPICVRGDHHYHCGLYGHCLILYLVGGGLWLSHRGGVLTVSWSGKCHVVSAWLTGLLGSCFPAGPQYRVVNPAADCFTKHHLRAYWYRIKYSHNEHMAWPRQDYTSMVHLDCHCGACESGGTLSRVDRTIEPIRTESFLITRHQAYKQIQKNGNLQEQWWKNHLVADKIPWV